MLPFIASLALTLLPSMPPSLQQSLGRRSVILRSAAAIGLGSVLPTPPSFAISATTMSGKSKPELGCIVAEEPTVVGKSGVAADLVLTSGLATVSFESPWKLAEGNYYDVAAKSQEGDAAFVQVADLPGKLSSLSKGFFSDTILSLNGYYGAYGQPFDGVFKETTASTANGAGARAFECTFTPLGPSGDGAPRKGIVTAVQPAGSKQVVMLVASTSATRWKKAKGEKDCRTAAESFTVRMSPTSLKAEPSSDFRYGKTSGPSGMKSRNDGF